MANAEPGFLSVIYNPLDRDAVGLNGFTCCEYLSRRLSLQQFRCRRSCTDNGLLVRLRTTDPSSPLLSAMSYVWENFHFGTLGPCTFHSRVLLLLA